MFQGFEAIKKYIVMDMEGMVMFKKSAFTTSYRKKKKLA